MQLVPAPEAEVLQEPPLARLARLYYKPAALIFTSAHMLATACAVTGDALMELTDFTSVACAHPQAHSSCRFDLTLCVVVICIALEFGLGESVGLCLLSSCPSQLVSLHVHTGVAATPPWMPPIVGAAVGSLFAGKHTGVLRQNQTPPTLPAPYNDAGCRSCQESAMSPFQAMLRHNQHADALQTLNFVSPPHTPSGVTVRFDFTAALNRYGVVRFWRAPTAPLRVVITGSTKGIGKALAREFLRCMRPLGRFCLFLGSLSFWYSMG